MSPFNNRILLDLNGLPSGAGPLQARDVLLLHGGEDCNSGDLEEPSERPLRPRRPGETIGPFGAVLWIVRRQGAELVWPPATHVVDHLVHSYALVDEEALQVTEAVNTVAVVAGAPRCTQCHTEARYDTYVTSAAGRRLACFLCADCFLDDSLGLLGPGQGQLLLTPSELPEAVVAVLRRLPRWNRNDTPF